MHPIDMLCKEYGITRYRLAKESGVRDTVFANLVTRNSPIENMKLGTLLKVAKAINVPVGDLIEKLLKYEEESLSK